MTKENIVTNKRPLNNGRIFEYAWIKITAFDRIQLTLKEVAGHW
jgi:hypothetical protein